MGNPGQVNYSAAKAGRDRAHQGGGARAGALEHPGQRGGAGADRDRHDRGHPGRGAARRCWRRCRSSASERRARWRRWYDSWPATARPTSRGRSSTSTAACTCSERRPSAPARCSVANHSAGGEGFMAKPVEERVKEIIVEQLGVEEDDVNPEREVHRGPGRRLPRHGRARHGLRGGVRSRDPRRGRREDRHGRRRHPATSRRTQ